MELYWKIRSSLYVHLLRYNLYFRKSRMNMNNYKGLQVITAVMIRTCTAVGCNYYEFEIVAARSYGIMQRLIDTAPARVGSRSASASGPAAAGVGVGASVRPFLEACNASRAQGSRASR